MPTNRTNLKNYFQKGDKPSALQFAELIDGNLNLEDGGTIVGQTKFVLPITASIISASGTIFASDFQSAGESSQTITFNDNLNVTGSFSMNGPVFDVNASSVVTIDGTQITLTTTPTDGVITLHSAHTAGQAILIDANAAAGSILDIDAGVLDIDVQGVTTINAGDVTITSPQISLQGNVTASGTMTTSGSIVHGNVSASGNIIATGFISASGRLQTLSHITASGNISSSGHISSSGLVVGGTGTFVKSPSISTGTITCSGIFNHPVFSTDNITAKVIASKNLAFGSLLSAGVGRLNIQHTDTDGTISNSTGDLSIINSNGDTIIKNTGPGGKILLNLDLAPSSPINSGVVLISGSAEGGISLDVRGNITSSGNILSSGSIVHGNISASGNIVATGFISASGRLQTLSHITASGNISASGYISSSGLIVAGGAQVGALVATTINTGEGATEVHLMDQDVREADAVVFATVNTGQGANELYGMNQNVKTTDAVVFTTINTGQGATEVHLMNQDVKTTDAVVFATVDTGQGANELFDMNQNVTTTSNVTFRNLAITGTGSLAVISSSRIDGNGYGNIVISGSLIPGTDDVFDLGSGSKEWSQLVVNAITASGNIKTAGTLAAGATTVGALVSTTINTGQGATEVHLMDQNVRQADAVVFATVNTGQGANELYDMDQNVTTTSNVFFSFISASGDISGSNLDAGGNISAVGHITASGRLQTLSHITASGNISSSGTIIAKSFVETVSTKAAGGDNLAGAAAVDATSVIFATTDDAAKGVRLPALTTLAIGQTVTVHNEAASTALRVYPSSGDVIGGLAEDAHATVPAKTAIVLTKRDANKFLGYFTTVIA